MYQGLPVPVCLPGGRNGYGEQRHRCDEVYWLWRLRWACPSGAISMVPVEYPPQQKKELSVLAQAQALTGNKAREEQMARQLAQVVQAPGLYRLLKAVERSARLVQEDLHRESGYMLPQSKNAHDLLKQLLENPPTPEFLREAAQALLEKLPQNEA